jgi:hypothetical protein
VGSKSYVAIRQYLEDRDLRSEVDIRQSPKSNWKTKHESEKRLTSETVLLCNSTGTRNPEVDKYLALTSNHYTIQTKIKPATRTRTIK